MSLFLKTERITSHDLILLTTGRSTTHEVWLSFWILYCVHTIEWGTNKKTLKLFKNIQ